MKQQRVFTKKNVGQAFGSTLVLFALLAFLSVGTTHLWGLAAGLYFLFGMPGYWFFLPFLLVIGLLFCIHGDTYKGAFGSRGVYGFFLFLLGLCTLWTDVGMEGAESSKNYSAFMDNFQAAISDQNFLLNNSLGGGIFGYTFASLLASGGRGLIFTIAILVMILGLAIITWPLLTRLFRHIKGVLVLAKAKRDGQKAREKNDEENLAHAERIAEANPLPMEEGVSYEAPNRPAPLIGAPLASGDPTPSPAEIAAPAMPEASAPETAVTPTVSRSELYASKPLNVLPQDVTTSEFAKETYDASPSELEVSGLQEAFFDPNAANARAAQASADSQSQATPSYSNEVLTPEEEKKREEKAVEAPKAPTPLSNQVSLDETVPLPEPTPAETSQQKEPISASSSDLSSAPAAASEPAVEPETLVHPEPTPLVEPEPEPAPLPKKAEPEPAPLVAEPEPEPEPAPADPDAQPSAKPRPKYTFPPLSLLKVYPPNGKEKEMKEEAEANSVIINQTFANFKVGARVVSYTIGPSVTRYDIQCDPDVQVSSLDHYMPDISVHLGGVAVRFEAIVRGKITSGLEIVNKTSQTVPLKDVVAALPSDSKKNLYIPFGESISGDFISADLSDFPHMLVAGATGSGKSVFMHGMIMSLIMRNRPEDLKIVMVDPKHVEMACYKEIPHLLCPIIKEPTEAKVCFEKLISEMERRYRVFEDAGVRNIREFNEYAEPKGLEKLPFIVVVVDEFADLVDNCKDIGGYVVRLAQKARAAGMHLIISTQRPSVDVITGVIKANLQTRVALSVASPTDSVTILNQGGAEELAGRGDMLVDCPLVSKTGLTRVQGCYVETSEIAAVTTYIKNQVKTEYDPRFLDLVDHEAQAQEQQAIAEANAPSKAELKAAEGDQFYEYVKGMIETQEYTSISRIQREFGVGFPRAGKLFARLQNEGIVSQTAESSSKGCKVLVKATSAPSLNPGSTDSATLAPTKPE